MEESRPIQKCAADPRAHFPVAGLQKALGSELAEGVEILAIRGGKRLANFPAVGVVR